MRILIVEDEPPFASLIEDSCRGILGQVLKEVIVRYTLEDALEYLKENRIDLCLLDLNLSGENGFNLLKRAVSMPFQTIVISAYGDRAITAYEYGVMDFIKKPFTRKRLQLALDRFLGKRRPDAKLKYLVYKKQREHLLLPLSDVMYLKSDRIVVEAFCKSDRPIIIDKHLNQLEMILPDHFIRIHRSYIINSKGIKSMGRKRDGNAFVVIEGGVTLPVSRSKVKSLKALLNQL